MATFLIIFGFAKTIASAVGSVIGAIVKATPAVVWICLLCFALGFCLSSNGCNFSVFPKREPRQPRITTPREPRKPIFPIRRDRPDDNKPKGETK